jgi:hypothetical protein
MPRVSCTLYTFSSQLVEMGVGHRPAVAEVGIARCLSDEPIIAPHQVRAEYDPVPVPLEAPRRVHTADRIDATGSVAHNEAGGVVPTRYSDFTFHGRAQPPIRTSGTRVRSGPWSLHERRIRGSI